jgi:hypothetical protein
MLIDCDTCVARDIACDECVVAVLLRSPAQPGTDEAPEPVELDADEHAALGTLAYVGLVPPLRLVPGPSGRDSGTRPHGKAGRRGIA